MTGSVTSLWGILKRSVADFFEDDAMTNAAAVSFYTALSFGPIIILAIWITSYLGQSTQQQVIGEVERLVGPNAGQAVDLVVQNAEQSLSTGTIAGLISIGVLLFSASGVFAQLQKALNRIWDVEARPGQGVGGWIRVRLLSLGMVIVLGFILAVALVISAALSLVLGGSPGWEVLNIGVSLIVFTLLFAAVYKILPDVRIAWSDVWVGAAITAVLFVVGKFAIGKYLGMSSVGSAYGAAGSLVVLLVWVYYSTLILFFGAEITQQYARRFGSRITPSAHARWTPGAPESQAGTAAHGAMLRSAQASSRREPAGRPEKEDREVGDVRREQKRAFRS